MADIIITTPKSEMKTAATEAEQCIRNGGGFYFRKFATLPRNLNPGSRIFYTEDGYVRGFAVVDSVSIGSSTCSTTGRVWEGYIAYMRADSWKWVKPIPLKGFQGWRYFDARGIEIVGGWRDPKPSVNA